MEKVNYPHQSPTRANNYGNVSGIAEDMGYGNDNEQMPAPPSYEQATGSSTIETQNIRTYPPVQVLPTPNAVGLSRPQVQQMSTSIPNAVTSSQAISHTPTTITTATTTPRVMSITTATTAPGGTIRVQGASNVYVRPQQNQQSSYAYATQQQPPILQQPIVFVQQPTTLLLGPDRSYVCCPSCHIQKLTRIEYEPGTKTHLMAALLCVFGLWCCVCLPYCTGSCMKTNHFCGNCNRFLGSYGRDL